MMTYDEKITKLLSMSRIEREKLLYEWIKTSVVSLYEFHAINVVLTNEYISEDRELDKI